MADDKYEVPQHTESDATLMGTGDADDAVPESAPSFSSSSFYIVGVGASAGGLEALEQLFGAMPEDTGMAFVVVQHLSPDFKSVMDELLARRTRIPVHLVEDGVQVEPNHIYLIPAKKEMIVSGGRLLLSDKGTSEDFSLPIDVFFRSLAQDIGPRAIGVVLSGAGSDGARGIVDIHDAGGIVLCQDEDSANFDGMPKSARDTGIVDHVMPPAQMPAVLSEYAQRPESKNDEPTATPRAYGVTGAFRFLQETYGIDFTNYKPSTVTRRIERRMQIARADSIEAYIERLSRDSEELDVLFRDLLIGVTCFFRDEAAFAQLEQCVIPDLVARSSPEDELRVWIAGCATGEEAYSLAILLLEELRKTNQRRRIRILATDIHRGSLDFASRGLYDDERVAHMRPELLERYFDKRGPNYQVSPELRQAVVFAPHNVLKDAPFTRLDLISCRNLLIYFQPLAQKKVLSLFHFALKRYGALFLGPSENIGGLLDDFETVDNHWRIFRKHRDVRLPRNARLLNPRMQSMGSNQGDGTGSHSNYSLSQVINVYDSLLSELMPPSLLVNERRELVHAFSGASRYLRVRDGRPSTDLLDMLAPDLKMVVTGALQRVIKEQTSVTYNGLRLIIGAEEKIHKVTVKPIVAPGSSLHHVLVSIEELDTPPRSVPAQADAELDLSQVSRDQLGSLEVELRRTKENLQATIEELESSNEELQAANEELLASNEELQSTNEELQSVNEELYTVNSEYQKKITELTQLTNDVDNLLASIEVGTVFLDHELCIRKFTPLVAEAFKLLPQDIGRPISVFTTSINHPSLMEDLAEALRSAKPIEREVRDRSGNWFFLRVLPYRAGGSVEGVVLTLIDINGLKAAEDAVFRERYLLNSLMDSVPDAIYFKNAAGRFVRVNKALAARWGLDDPENASGKTAKDLLPEEQARSFDRLDLNALGGEAQPYRLEQTAVGDGRASWFTTTRQPLWDRDGKVVGMLGVARDVTEQKRAEDEIRLAVTRRDAFLAMLSHELRNPLSAIVNAAILLHQLDGSFSLQQGNCLNVIERQSGQMTRLLDDLLEVSRVTQNKIELRRQVIDARTVLNEAVAATREKFAQRKVSLKVEMDARAVLVDADPARFQQIVVNLLDNASKYNHAGGNVGMRLQREAEHAVLAISDDGAGIDPAFLGNVFDLFVQGRATLDRIDGGMGVGLTLVRSLVELHGGTISAHSQGLGHGSQFTAKIPLARTFPKADAAARPSSPWPSGKRVVIIEDNVDSCEMLRLLLERAGFEVHCAGDGRAGLDLIQNVNPDIAIVDLGLPLMNGFELAKQVRAQSKYETLHMVALTGYGQAADHTAALKAGFDQHLVKPLDPRVLDRLMGSQP